MTEAGMADLRMGMKRQAKIERSGIRMIFTPHESISSISLFFGRQAEVHRIIDAILTPGQHPVLYGERGVGKSSLANVSSEVLFKELVGGRYIQCRCDSSSTFADIATSLLDGLGIDLENPAIAESRTTSARGGIQIPGLAAGVGVNVERTETRRGGAVAMTPSNISRAIQGHEGLLVIDEFDAVQSRRDREQVAELIKQLSDSHSKLKILVVGIGNSVADLFAGHPSVERHIKEVLLRRMSQDEIRNLVLENAKKAKLTFDASVTEEIVRLSSGYPHFAHLLGLKCAEIAVVEDRTVVTPEDLPPAMRAAVADAEETLRRAYADAVRSHNTEMYAEIVYAAASIDTIEFNAALLRRRVSERVARQVSQSELNNHFQRLVAADESKILQREAKGVYRFSDPRMKSYVRIVLLAAELERD